MMETKKELINEFYNGTLKLGYVYDCATEYHQLTRALIVDGDYVFGYVIPYNGTKKEFFKRKIYYSSDKPFFKLNNTVYYLREFINNMSYDYKEDMEK